MIRAFKIKPLLLSSAVFFLMIGEMATGTSLLFIVMMAVTILSIGVTYNYLGGLSTLSGWLFIEFALRTIVISQFAKVALFEAADKNLEMPQLTISAYAVFYLSLMVGVFIFAKIRLPLPKPLEPRSITQARLLYLIALSIGMVATFVYESHSYAYGSVQTYGTARSMGLAFSPLLLFSLVVAVDSRIRVTGGKHSFDLAVMIPWIAATLSGFVDTVREQMIAPTIIYFAACYLRGYHFRKRHYIILALNIAFFILFIAPLELYTRDFIRDQPLEERAYWAFHILALHHDPVELHNAAEESVDLESGRRSEYFSRPGTFLLSRLSLIRADSNVISACTGGFHYGLAPTMIELQTSIPTFLYKNKPRYTSGPDYIGRVSGVSEDVEGTTYPAISAVGDSYGAFGWLGVILFPLLCIPALFIVLESVFDWNKPWGTVAFGTCFLMFGEMTVMRYIPLIVRVPLIMVPLSYLIGGLVKMIPTKGDREVGLGPKYHKLITEE